MVRSPCGTIEGDYGFEDIGYERWHQEISRNGKPIGSGCMESWNKGEYLSNQGYIGL